MSPMSLRIANAATRIGPRRSPAGRAPSGFSLALSLLSGYRRIESSTPGFMHKLLFALFIVALFRHAPQTLSSLANEDWQGKPVADLKAGLGEPTRVIAQSDGAEIWEYINTGDFVAPKEENTSFQMGGAGGGGVFGASGGINTVTQAQRLSRYENISSFRIKNGKVKGWGARRVVDGRVVWEDH